MTPPGETPPTTPPTTTAPDVTPPATTAPDVTPPATTAPGVTPPTPSAPTLTKLDPEAIPESCASLAKAADATSINRALSARISLAGCLADAGLKTLVLCDCAQSVQEIDTVTELSRVLFDEAISLGDATTQILARRAKGDLLSNLATRMVATVPPPRDASPEAIALHDSRVDILSALLQPWQLAARVEYEELDKTARANPQLAKNPAVAAAVRASRDRLAATQGVAKR
ncbi:MAG: hypothetical protein HOV81_43890 [Kofleriaceae bacterium]|nr:hypothetical protein [Kofleriaceae bacterium]